jgi:hypothetical protein
MGEVIVICALCAFGCWAYRRGKRTGSRQGYSVGRYQRRRR